MVSISKLQKCHQLAQAFLKLSWPLTRESLSLLVTRHHCDVRCTRRTSGARIERRSDGRPPLTQYGRTPDTWHSTYINSQPKQIIDRELILDPHCSDSISILRVLWRYSLLCTFSPCRGKEGDSVS